MFLFFILFVLITIFSGLVYLAVQQNFRNNANDPQIQMAEDAANLLSQGIPPEQIVPRSTIDISESIAPYITIFDDSGNPLATSGLLDGNPPSLPDGVLDYVRQNGEDRVTWQPSQHVRSAIVVTRYTGSKSGFVLAGRSLRETEKRVSQLTGEVFIAWFTSLAFLVVVGIFNKIFRRRQKWQ